MTLLLDDIAIANMTAEQALHRAFALDWNNQRTALDAQDGCTITVHLTFDISVTPETMRAALKTFKGMGQRGNT